MVHHNLKLHDIVVAPTIDKITITKTDVIEALEKIKEIPKQTKAEMTEVIEDSVINKLQDVIELPWADAALEYLPDLIELLKTL